MLERLACKLGRNDETPNIELAEYLSKRRDSNGIKQIVDGLNGKDKAVASDCIKVLYEIGARNPALICDYANNFIKHLHSKNNRLVWGSMTALAKIVELAPQPIFDRVDAVIFAYKTGSVITVDNSISVFAGLYKAGDSYAKAVLPILLEHLRGCRPKELPQHAERASVCFNAENAGSFIDVLESGQSVLTGTGFARITRLLKALYALKVKSI